METDRERAMDIDNEFYDTLGDDWYDAHDHPIAILRAESEHRNPWVDEQIARACHLRSCHVLDIGCGAGFLTNHLAGGGHEVVGLDISTGSIRVARRHDATGTVRYVVGDAYGLPFPDGTFHVACCMDVLEHIEEPERLIAEASRVIAPGGAFIFFTFNRTWFAWLTAVKGLQWFIANAPKNIHVYRLFIKPGELRRYCAAHGLQMRTSVGFGPGLFSPATARMVLTRRVPRTFSFRFTRCMLAGYVGVATKR